MQGVRFATIGTFDGVHRGHQLLLAALKEEAERTGLSPAAFIFETHPLAVIAPERVPPQLSSFEQKAALVRACGVEPVRLRFDAQMRGMTSRMFMAKIRDEFGVKGLLVGHDNRFGSDREATVADYVRHGAELGIIVKEAPVLPGINSSAVRRALLEGDVAAGRRMLGRPYRLTGTVVHGQHLGSQLGFPTANLAPDSAGALVPARGVYATRVRIAGSEEVFPAVTNIGVRPTVKDADGSLSIETHIPGYDADLYTKTISLDFIDKIRNEKQFSSLDELRSRLFVDIEEAKRILSTQTDYSD